MTKTTFKFPKSLAVCADRYYELRNKRLEAEKIAAGIEEEEKALKEHLIAQLPKSEASGIAGKLCRVTVTSKQVPQVEDWDAFYKHVAKTKSFELLQRRLGDAAIKERWDNGKEVPGVGHFTVTTLSVNKV